MGQLPSLPNRDSRGMENEFALAATHTNDESRPSGFGAT
jgi:hypothetical protein